MARFSKSVGERLRLTVGDNGYLNHAYGHGAQLEIRQGWNEACDWVTSDLSIDDLKDLRYLIERALESRDGVGLV